MKKYTIIERVGCDGTEVMLISTADIYQFVHLCTAEDGAYILKDGELMPTREDFNYPSNYFDDGEEGRLVLKVSDFSKFGFSENDWAKEERFAIRDEWDEEDIELIDVTMSYMGYISGSAVDIEHGINTTTVCFNVEDCGDEWWHSVGEVDATYEVEHLQDYPHQEFTRVYTCDNGVKIREISPFFTDEQMDVYEYVKEEN